MTEDLNNNIPQQSMFNAGMAKLQRIHEQRRILQYARLYKDYDVFANAMFNIRSEINERLDTEERKEGDIFESQIRGDLYKYNYHKHKLPLLPFINYERWLSDKEFKYGMSLPSKEDNRFGFSR